MKPIKIYSFRFNFNQFNLIQFMEGYSYGDLKTSRPFLGTLSMRRARIFPIGYAIKFEALAHEIYRRELTNYYIRIIF